MSYYQPPSPHYNLSQTFNGFAPQAEYVLCTQPSMLIPQMPPPMPPMPQQVYTFPAGQQPESLLQLFSPHPPQMVPMPQAQTLMLPPPPAIIQAAIQQRPAPRAAKTEARKIIITGLPPTATQKTVHELIQSVSSTASPGPKSRHRNSPDGTRYYLQHLELAKNHDGSTKGHAFAVLESQATAKSTIDALNGMGWQGRRLHARFAKEGVESGYRGTRHGKRSDAGPGRLQNTYDVGTLNGGRVRAREPYVPRTTLEAPQYRYIGNNTGMEVDTFPSAQFANIQIDYRADHSSSSSSLISYSQKEESISSFSSLSSEGEKERGRKMLSDDAGNHTPMVVDGSSCGKRGR